MLERAGAVIVLLSLFWSSAIAGGIDHQAPKPAFAVAQKPALAYRFTPGARRHYTLVYETDSISDFNGAVDNPNSKKSTLVMSPLANAFKTYLGGELTMTVLERTDAVVLVAYELREPVVKLKIQGQQDEEQVALIRRELSQPVFVLISPQGRILSLILPPALHAISQNFIKSTLAITEFVLPVEGQLASNNHWQAEEEDSNGRYIAAYTEPFPKRSNSRASVESSLKTFRKIRVKYLANAGGKREQGVYEIAPAIASRGGFKAQINTDQGQLISLAGGETQIFSLAGHVVGQARTTLQMQFFKSETVSPPELTQLLHAKAAQGQITGLVRLYERPSAEETEAALQRGNLGEATLESLLAAIDPAQPGQSAQSTSSSADTKLYLKFRALVYLQPETSAKLGQILSTTDPKGRAATILTDALMAVGHEQAQAALVSAIRARPANDILLPKLLLALGRTAAPAPATEDVFREIAMASVVPEVSELALYLLGNTARSLAATSPERATKTVDLLIGELAKATAPELAGRYLLALGATTSERALPVISNYLFEGPAQLRVVAVSSLHPINTGAADELLLRVLSGDREAEVRYHSALVLHERKMTRAAFLVQQKVFATDKDENVRLAILNNLWQARDEFPEVRMMVKRAAQNDGSEAIRRAARSVTNGS